MEEGAKGYVMISFAAFTWEFSTSMPPLRRHASVTYSDAGSFTALEIPTLRVPLRQSFIFWADIWEVSALTEGAYWHTSSTEGHTDHFWSGISDFWLWFMKRFVPYFRALCPPAELHLFSGMLFPRR